MFFFPWCQWYFISPWKGFWIDVEASVGAPFFPFFCLSSRRPKVEHVASNQSTFFSIKAIFHSGKTRRFLSTKVKLTLPVTRSSSGVVLIRLNRFTLTETQRLFCQTNSKVKNYFKHLRTFIVLFPSEKSDLNVKILVQL